MKLLHLTSKAVSNHVKIHGNSLKGLVAIVSYVTVPLTIGVLLTLELIQWVIALIIPALTLSPFVWFCLHHLIK